MILFIFLSFFFIFFFLHFQLRSPKKQKLNDLNWHDVAIQRFENNITLQVGGTIIRKTLPPEMGALNIHFGTILGGPGEYSAEFLNDVGSFRGCMSDVSV